jgi:hypothetical protein
MALTAGKCSASGIPSNIGLESQGLRYLQQGAYFPAKLHLPKDK